MPVGENRLSQRVLLASCGAVLVVACGGQPGPLEGPDQPASPQAPIQMIDRAQDVADQVEQRNSVLEGTP